MANLGLVWTKTTTGYEAKSAFGHYVATRDGRGRFALSIDGVALDKGPNTLAGCKDHSREVDDERNEAAQKEADARDTEDMAGFIPNEPTVEQNKDHQCYECANPLSPVEMEHSLTVCNSCYKMGAEEWYRNEGQQLEAEAIKDGELVPAMPVVDNTCPECNGTGKVGEQYCCCVSTKEMLETMATSHEGGYTLRGYSLPPMLSTFAAEPVVPVPSLGVPSEVFRGEGGNTIPNKDPHMSSSPPRVDSNLAKSTPKMGDVVRFTIILLGVDVESEECRVDHVVGRQCKLSRCFNGQAIPGLVSNERITIMRRPARIVGGVAVGPWTSSR